MVTVSRILLIEDETSLALGLKFNLVAEGYEVEITSSGEAGLALLKNQEFDLVILDIMLPGIDGFEVARTIRVLNATLPIFMLTALVSDRDRITGFECGAEDYLIKPFNLRELLLRIKALLRRSELYKTKCPKAVEIGLAQIDFDKGVIVNRGESSNLTAQEIMLLQYLLRNPNRVISRDELLANVWGYSKGIETRTIDAFISRLRKKIEADPANPQYIVSIRGRGYCFTLSAEKAKQ